MKKKINSFCNALRYFIMLINQGCETGTYGESCLKKCYHCKNNATCGIQNGECDGSGCIGLYKPPLCKGKPMLCESGTKCDITHCCRVLPLQGNKTKPILCFDPSIQTSFATSTL